MHPVQATTTVWDGSSPGIFESYAKCGKHTGSGISTGRASEPEDDALGTGLKGGLQQLTGPTTRRGTPSSPVWLDQLDPRCLSQFNDGFATPTMVPPRPGRDRKSTRLNSSHVAISYAVFCLKKKKLAARVGACT